MKQQQFKSCWSSRTCSFASFQCLEDYNACANGFPALGDEVKGVARRRQRVNIMALAY